MGSYTLPGALQIPPLAPFSLLYLAFCFPCSLSASILLCSYIFNRAPSSSAVTFSSCGRISTEHSPKLQIRSHSYLRAVSEVSINRSLDSLDPAGLLASPKFRSRNESYMRAMSTISQVSGTQGPRASLPSALTPPVPQLLCPTRLCRGEDIPPQPSLGVS